MRHFLLYLSLLLGISVNATECNNLTLTVGTYPDTTDLIAAIQGEYGSGYTIGDWNDLEAIDDIDDWISCMGLEEDESFMLTRNGEYFYNGNRQYFVIYSTDGVGSGFLIHDQIGDLYLGSWYGLNYHILAKNECNSNECNNLKNTCGTYAETDDLIAAIQGEFGSGYTIGDWNDLEAIDDIDDWISCMGLEEDESFMLTRNGEYFYNGNRQYFVIYSTDGVGSGFLIHDQIGDLYLGSWYGLNYHILAKNEATSIFENNSSEFIMYPNPASKILNIRSDVESDLILNIFNSYGQNVISNETFRGNSIDISSFPNGIYFVRLSEKNGTVVSSRKIIKE